VLAATVLVALVFGAQSISIPRALSEPSLDRSILLGLRLPRVALCVVSGAGLAVVGGVLQALLRNPLADPYVLGVSGGAALGATIWIAIGGGLAAVFGGALVSLAAILGGMAATLLVYLVARGSERATGTTILLAGVIVNAICSSLISFIKTLVSAAKAQELLFWLMGFIESPTPSTLAVLTAYVTVGLAILAADSARINLLALGQQSAQHLGVNVRALERRVVLASSLVVGAIVSVTGLIGFVGLVVPHAARRLVGPDLRVLLIACAMIGAAMLVGCDLASRAAFRWIGTEPPVGAVTALVGGPLFLVLLQKRAKGSGG
jgi:iron complex transport system permease protein